MTGARAIVATLVVLVCGLSLGQRAEVSPAAGSSGGEPHGWVALPAHDAAGNPAGATLAHVPPRRATGSASAAPDGRLARAARLARRPAVLAASGAVVYVLTERRGTSTWDVARLRAEPRGYNDLWAYLPPGRLRVQPAFDAADGLIGVASNDEVLYALADRSGVAELWRLAGGAWALLGLVERSSAGSALTLHADEAGLVAVERSSRTVVVHAIDADGSVASATSYRVESDGADGEVLGVWRGEVVLADRPDASTLVVRLLGRGGAVTLEPVSVPERAGVMLIGGSARVIAVWDSARETDAIGSALPTPGVGVRVQRLVELSLVTGRMLYNDVATTSSPISGSEFRLLALLLFGLMMVVLIMVLRPAPAGDLVVLPPGTAIAPGGLRVLATLLDFAPGVLIASRLAGVSVAETLGPIALPITGSLTVLPLALALVISASHAAAGEAVFGRSFGKLLTGLFVARVDPVPGSDPEPGRFRPPTPGGAVLRNAVKWLVPPAAALALSDPDGRHRGDVVARTAVLTARPVEP